MTVVPAVLAQHAEEAAFLWLLRDAAVVAPHHSLADLAALDNRVEAHVDGLRIAGEAGWELCAQQLEWREAGEVFAAAVLALENGEQRKWRDVLEVGTSTPEAARGLVSALGWLPYEHVAAPIAELLAISAPEYRRVGIAAAAAHRLGSGRAVEDSLDAGDWALRARALRAAGQLGLHGLLPAIAARLTDSDVECRFSAAWSVALFGGREAISTLQGLATGNSPYHQEAAATALRCMNLQAATAWQRELAQTPRLQRLGVVGAGVVGDPVAVEWLIEQMSCPDLARVAGEAFCMITGVDLGLQDLEGKRPDGFAAGPTEGPEDDNVSMDADENLRWPDAIRVARWWHAHSAEFEAGRRYLVGKPISRDSLEEALRSGFQRQRAAAALELALLDPGRPLFEVRAPGHRQSAPRASSPPGVEDMERSIGNIIPEIVQEHFDTYRFLWNQRQGALRSPDFTVDDLARVEARMEAHLDGLLVAGEGAMPLVAANLAADDASAVLAAALVLLAFDRDDAAAKVVGALLQAQGPQIDGLRQALCLGDITRIVPRLRELFASPSSLAAAVAAEALAFHRRLDASSLRLAALLTDEDPAVRRVAWRVVAILDSADRRSR